MTKNLLLLIVLLLCTPAFGQSVSPDAIVGQWTWKFSEKKSDNPNDLIEHKTVTFTIDNADRNMKWDENGDKGKWEGPTALAVLIRWNKGTIDMLELKNDGKTLEGKNQQGKQVKGTRQGAASIDDITGTWDWAFSSKGGKGPFGKPELQPCGTVKFFLVKHRVEWTPPFHPVSGCGTRNPLYGTMLFGKDEGTWEGPVKQAVLLRWEKGSVDQLELTNGGKMLEGHNREGLLVRGEKK